MMGSAQDSVGLSSGAQTLSLISQTSRLISHSLLLLKDSQQHQLNRLMETELMTHTILTGFRQKLNKIYDSR